MSFFFKFEIFSEIYPPTRYINYKVIIFAPSNKSIMANQLPSTNLELLLRLKFRLRVNSEKYIARYLYQIGGNGQI